MQTQTTGFLTVQEAADLLGIRNATVRHWIFRREKLAYVKVGRAVRIPKDAVDRLIKENTFAPRVTSSYRSESK